MCLPVNILMKLTLLHIVKWLTGSIFLLGLVEISVYPTSSSQSILQFSGITRVSSYDNFKYNQKGMTGQSIHSYMKTIVSTITN